MDPLQKPITNKVAEIEMRISEAIAILNAFPGQNLDLVSPSSATGAGIQQARAMLEQARADLQQVNLTVKDQLSVQSQLAAALSESEARFKLITDAFPVAVGISSLDGRLIYLNRVYEHLYDYTLEEISRLNANDLYNDPQDRLTWLKLLKKNGIVRDFEVQLKRKDGSLFWASLTATRCNYAGQPAVIGTILDITRRKQIEANLSENEERFSIIFNDSPYALSLTQMPEGTLVEVNNAFLALFAITRQEAIGKTEAELNIADEASRLQVAANLQKDGYVRDFECNRHSKSGEMLVLALSLDWISLGAKKYVLTTIRDITAQKHAEQDLATLHQAAEIQHQRLVAVMQALPVGVALVDEQGGNILGNQAFEKIWGDPRPSTTTVSDYHAYKAWWVESGELVKPEEWASAQAVQKGLTVTGQLMKIQRFDGATAYIHNSGAPIFDEQGKVVGCAVAIQDITELKQRENEIRLLNRTLKALSNSNQAMIHAVDEKEFLEQTCRIIVEDCGFAMVWIGFAENDKHKSVHPVASAGFEQGYLDQLNITWANTARGRGPTGTAIRTKKPSRCNNMLTDPKFAPWRAAALERGYASSIVLPLIAGDRAFGALNIYSREPEDFTDDEEKLLMELAGDLAFGITTLRLRAEQARAEDALRKSEQRYRSLFDNMTEGFALHEIICDGYGQPCDYRFLEVNPTFERFTGLERQNIIGRLASQVLPGLEPTWVQNYGQVALTGNAIEFDQFTQILGRHFRVYAYRPAPSQFATIFTDITGQKQIERQLTTVAEKYATLFNSTSDGVWIHNLDGIILEVNQAYCEMSGYACDELINMPVSKVEAVESAPEIAQHIRKLLDQKGHDRFETKHRRKDGTLFDVDITALYFDQEGGRIAIFVRDITERKQAEEAIRRSEAMLRAVIDQMPSGVTVRDAKTGSLLLANNRSREILGQLAANTSQFTIYQGFHPDGRPYKPGEWPVNRSMATGESINAEEIECVRNDGSHITLSMSAAPIYDDHGNVIIGIGVFHDITERKRAEEHLAYLASFPENNPRPIVEVDIYGHIHYINPAASRLFPDLADKRLTHSWLVDWNIVVDYFTQDRFGILMRDVAVNERFYEQSMNYVSPQGLIRIYGLDITERKRAEKALRQARDELEQRVTERTQELNIVNNQLRAEVSERQKIQTDLESSLQELQVIEEELRNNNEMLIDAQKVLEGERQRYQDLFDFAPDGYLVTDGNGQILEANQFAASLLQISHQSLIGKPLIVFVARDDHPVFTHQLINLKNDRDIQSLELKLLPRNGREITTAATVASAKDRNGKDTLRWTIRDITDRIRAEEIIRQNSVRNAVLSDISESLAEASLDEKAILDIVVKSAASLVGDSCVINIASPDGQQLSPSAWYHTRSETQELMNTLFSKTTNPRGDGLSRRVFETSQPVLIAEADDKQLAGIPEGYREYIKLVGIESMLIVPLQVGNKTIGTISLVRNGKDHPYSSEDQALLEIIANRTAQTIHNARLYQELQNALRKELETHDQLVQAEKFAAVGRLLASITHEINNPLQTIKNCLYLSQMDTPPGTPASDALNMAAAETNRLSNLVAQLREMYRPPTVGQSRPVNLPALLGEVQTLLASYLQEKHVSWQLTLPDPNLLADSTIEGVPDQLKQVFLNICLNSIDAMEPDGGNIIINFKVSDEKGLAGISFKDTGPGIAKEVQDKLFEPFITTKEKGLGLGLVICYDIIHKHNGNIEVFSEPGRGAQFTIWLPVKRKDV